MITSFKAGDWVAICDRCGFKMHASRLKKTWDNFMVCGRCWYPRHPQETLRGIKDDQTVPWSNPEATDTFITKDDVTAEDL